MANNNISIIIPAKNEAQYIARTLAQFHEYLERLDLEVIVSDANSTDATAEIVLGYAAESNQRIHLVQSAGKQNIAIGRNAGAAQAKGDILLHIDADVLIMEPEKFFEQIRLKFENPAVLAATVPLWIYPEKSGLADKLFHLFMNTVIRLSFLFRVFLAKGECQIVRRAAFECIGGYNEELVAGEDCNLFYRLGKTGRIAYLHRLSVHHSPRRFREYGYLKVSMIYLREGLWLLFRKKSYIKEWTVVR